MTDEYKRLTEICSYIREKTDFVPRAALTLGSGLGDYAGSLDVVYELDYRDIPGFPVSTAPGHKGMFIFGYCKGTPVVCMRGRVRMYEGYSAQTVVMPVRIMKLLGAEVLFLTNAAGGIDRTFRPGDLCLITDHISSFAANPLIGPNIRELGVRFPDMTNVYDRQLQELVRQCAAEEGISLKEGVYLQTTGPSFESPAEIRMFEMLGASAVGMSTVVEAIAARHMGMKVVCVSLISNLAAGISERELSSEEVDEAGKNAAGKFSALVTAVISRL